MKPTWNREQHSTYSLIIKYVHSHASMDCIPRCVAGAFSVVILQLEHSPISLGVTYDTFHEF
jgi:hypothetical protein